MNIGIVLHSLLHKKKKFAIKDFFSKCDQMHSFLFHSKCEENLNGKLHFFMQ